MFSGRYCWNILICLLLDTILDLLRLPSKLASPTALQALACFLVQLLAAFATSSSGGAKTEKLYNDLDFGSLKEAFCGIEWTAKNLSLFFLLRTNFFLSRKQTKITQQWTFLLTFYSRFNFLNFSETLIINMLIFFVALFASKCFCWAIRIYY